METEPPHYSAIGILFFALQIDVNASFLLISVLVLLVISGLVSASEVAYFSLDNNDFKVLSEENSDTSRRILALKDKPRYLLATILIANNLVNIAIIIFADLLLKDLLGVDFLLFIGEWLSANVFFAFFSGLSIAHTLNFLITVVGVTFLLLLFGEATPKIYATANRFQIVKIMAMPLTALNYFFSPFSKLLVKMSSGLEERLANNSSQAYTSKEDIDAAIDLTVTSHENSGQEADILKGIVNFGDTSAKQIMHSRTDVVAADVQMNYKELLKIVKDSGYSRIPIFNDVFDNIVGILYVKDLLAHLDENEDFEWQKLVRENVLYVPESKKIDELLREFQTKKTHMAIIVDEYGGSAGIATLEDIMEEVVGDIKDEFDQDEEIEFIKIAENHYIFEGKTLLKDVCRAIGVSTGFFDEINGYSDSLAGLFIENVGFIPKAEKEITLQNITLKVVSANKKRIEKISLILNE